MDRSDYQVISHCTTWERSSLATTSCKTVETLPWKNNLSCFKSLLVTLTSLLLPIQSCSSRFWAWSCIASNFDKGCRGDHKHKIMDRTFMPKYGTVSQVLLSLVAVCFARQAFSYRLFGNKSAYKKRMTQASSFIFCRIKPLKNGHLGLIFFPET